MKATFDRYIGIEYSGAETRESSLKRPRTRDQAHFWPFDRRKVPSGKSAVVEVYPALLNHSFPRNGRDSHQQDAYATAEWLRRNDLGGSLERHLGPSLTDHEREVAKIEGGILGVA